MFDHHRRKGYHTGLVLRQLGQVYFDDKSLLIHPNYIAEPPEVKLPVTPPEGGGKMGDGDIPPPPPPPSNKVLSRYYGWAGIDARRVNKMSD